MRRLLAAPVLALALVPAARAEVVAQGVDDAALAVAPDGSPRIAYVARGRLHVASRAADGWHEASPRRLRTAAASVVGIAGRGALTAALVEDDRGGWLALYSARGRTTSLRFAVIALRGARLGVAGLVLDRKGHPAVAYAYRVGRGKTYLRLLRCAKRCVDRRVTRAGFPSSLAPPGAAPVAMPDGTVRVIETYVGQISAAIEWRPVGRDWSGKFIFGNTLGQPLGLVRGLASGGDVYAAWTESYPSFGESHVLLTRHYLGPHDPQEETVIVLSHAALIDLAATPDGLEVGANDWATVDDVPVEAAVLALPGLEPVELDGALLGYASAGSGARDVLLSVDGVLSWYRAPARPAVRVRLAATSGPALTLSGSVAGSAGGSVELYRERPRLLVAAVPVAADGTFTATIAAPTEPALYRAVYRGAPDGLPYASLLRAPAG